MANLITATEIAGASVYGVAQMSYAVDGVSGKDYAAALSAAAFKEAVAIERTLSGYSEVVRQRIRKLEVLGEVMAEINAAISTLKVKEPESDDTTDYTFGGAIRKKAAEYGIDLFNPGWVPPGVNPDNVGVSPTRANIYKKQNEVQYAIDREDNDLKQDMVSLNSAMSKRDNAFSAASKLVKKAVDASGSTIDNIG